jgi:hypothetical protein
MILVMAIIPLNSIALPEIRASTQLAALFSPSRYHNPRGNASLGDRDSGGLPLAFPSCNMTWLMEEMPHNDVASCCLATPWHYASGKDLSELPRVAETTICAICLNLG